MPRSKRTQRPEWTTQRLEYNLETLIPLLYQAGEISEDQVRLIRQRAIAESIDGRSPKGFDFLLQLNLSRKSPVQSSPKRVTEEVVLQAVGRRSGLETKRVDYLDLDLEVSTKTISESFARKHLLVPLRVVEGVMELLVFNPFQPELWEDMERVSSMEFRVFLGTRAEIERLIDDYFRFRLAIQAAASECTTGADLGNLESKVRVSGGEDSHTHKHVIQAVDYLLRSALRERASDIHLEPKRDEALVRFRIDGVLHTLYRLPFAVHQAMISRLKSLSRLDIAEKRKPQDGRIQLELQNVPTDVRISTIPVAFGEKMVLRLLSSESTIKNLSDLGMNAGQLPQYEGFLQQPYGLILVTGPTGSGKSTTLYSTLKHLAEPSLNLVTLEDPIEMVVDEFNQIGVQPRIGITFSEMIRYILRQDPDIIMVGEIRDLDTARQAIQAALTGHLVFSTLHTNDAASSLTRLLDLGLEPFMINSALIGVVAQRLVRCICPHCQVVRELDLERLRSWGLEEHALYFENGMFEGTGCEHCRRTGYFGRIGIFEIMPVDGEVKQGLKDGLELSALQSLVRRKGIPDLLQAGVRKAAAGETTLSEVLRVAGGSQATGFAS
jgi:general secretion pathway protein E